MFDLLVGAMHHNGYVDEIWKPVVGYEGMYEVSNQGRVRSLDRLVGGESRGRRFMRGRILKTYVTKHGYITFSAGGNTRFVHHAVLEAFVGPRPEGMECCHNDGNRANNAVGNLRWDSRYGNCQDIRAHGTHWQTKKTHCPRGHAYDAEARTGNRVMRVCKTCKNERARAKYRMEKTSPAI